MKRFRLALTLGASTIGMASAAAAQDAAAGAAVAPAAQAQAQSGGAGAPDQQADNADNATGSDVVVTGTRIVRDGYTAPTPVTVASTEDLFKATPSSIPDALNKLPQFQNSLSPSRAPLNFSNAPIHGNVLNLRGLGTPGPNPKGPLRTLILFDGVRVPPTSFVGTIDTNVLPQLLLSRVDVVTGGASASWGSDAVAGVVNFVLDKQFTGIRGVAQAGVSERGDNANQRIGIAAGGEFAGGRGHILASVEYTNNDGLRRSDRDISLLGYDFVGAVPGGGAPGTATNPYVIGSNIRISALSNLARITGSSVSGNAFIGRVVNPDGTTRAFDAGTPVGTTGFQSGGDGYAINQRTHAVAPNQNAQGFARASFDVAPDINIYAQGIAARSTLAYNGQSNVLVPPSGGVQLYKGNPYLSSTLDAALPTSADYFTVGQYDAGQPQPLIRERIDYWMTTAGIDAKFGSLKFAANYTHGESRHAMDASGLYDNKRLYAAIDAVRNPSTGQITCRVLLDPTVASQYAGCQPLNILAGNPAAATPAGYAYATGTSRYVAKTTQDSFAASLAGSLFSLPAGPVDFVIGGEYRDQKLNLVSNADPATLVGSTAAQTAAIRSNYFAGLRGVPSGALYYWLTNVGSAQGSQNVKEAFGEIAVPILKDTPFFQELSLSAAGRVTDYSTSGTVETWKVGATWRPIRDLLLRGTLSRDIRAPNLFELFAGSQSGIGIVNDLRNAAGTYGSGLNVNVNSVTGGNRNLVPETAKTWTVGGVLSPRFIPGLSLSVDYYNIKVDKLIDSLSAQQIITNCFNAGGSGVPECSLIDRSSPTAFPSLVRIVPANIAYLETQGIDFDATYRRDLGAGNLGVRLYANYLARFRSQQYTGAPVLDFAGVSVVGSNPAGYPRWRGSLTVDYANGPFGITVNEQYLGKMTLGIPGANQVFAQPNVKQVFYTDLTLRFLVGEQKNFEFFTTVNNLFDRRPPLIPGTVPGVNLPTNIAVYDFIGRSYTAGVRFRF